MKHSVIPPQKIFTAYTLSMIIKASLTSGVLDYINTNSPTIFQLKEEYKKFSKIEILLKILCEMGIVMMDKDNYRIQEDSLYLLSSDTSGSRDSILFSLEEGMKCWDYLGKSIKDGDIAFESCFKQKPFEYFANDEISFNRFYKSMRQSTGRKNLNSIAKHISSLIPNSNKVTDVGCGNGMLLRTFRDLSVGKELVGIDLPYVIENTSRFEDVTGLTLIKGNFFQKVPPSDVYVLSRILHDWQRNDATRILKNLVGSMNSNSRIFVVEKEKNEKKQSLFQLIGELNLWLMCGGEERSFNDFEKLFHECNLKVFSVKVIGKMIVFEVGLV